MCTGYISPSNGQGVVAPKLRFSGFSEDWELVRIGDVYAERSERGAENMDLLSVTMTDGVKMRSDIEGKDNSSEDKSNYKIVYTGDMVYNSMRMWQGASGISPYDGIVSPAYTILKPRIPISNGFFAALFKNERLINAFRKNSQGMTSDTWNLKYPQIETIKIHIPTVSEQEKIAEFIALIDAKISKQRILVDSLKKYKRGLLQQIFSRKLIMTVGDESWEYIPLGEIGCFFGGLTGKSKEDFDHGDSKFITYMNVYKNTFADETMVTAVDVAPNEKQNTVQYGDILFTQSSETVEEVGLSSVWVHDTTPYLNSFCMALRPRSLEKYNPYYLGYALRSPKIREAIMKEGQGISRINLAASRIENIPIPIPPAAVQIKIADYLKKWDDRIYANEKTLTELISLKKAFLQSLFI